MKPGDAIRIPAEKTRRMQVWTAVNRLNRATGWDEYEYHPIISPTGKKFYHVKRHTKPSPQPDWVGTLISEAEANEDAQVNQSPNHDNSDDQ